MKLLYLLGIYGFYIAPIAAVVGLFLWYYVSGWAGIPIVVLSVATLVLRLILGATNVQ